MPRGWRRSDAALMRRVQRDADEGAFAELYDRVAPRALGLSRAPLGRGRAAEDVVQEAFVGAWRARAFATRLGLPPGLVRARIRDGLRRRRA